MSGKPEQYGSLEGTEGRRKVQGREMVVSLRTVDAAEADTLRAPFGTVPQHIGSSIHSPLWGKRWVLCHDSASPNQKEATMEDPTPPDLHGPPSHGRASRETR
jgi:hypothetical protein